GHRRIRRRKALLLIRDRLPQLVDAKMQVHDGACQFMGDLLPVELLDVVEKNKDLAVRVVATLFGRVERAARQEQGLDGPHELQTARCGDFFLKLRQRLLERGRLLGLLEFDLGAAGEKSGGKREERDDGKTKHGVPFRLALHPSLTNGANSPRSMSR